MRQPRLLWGISSISLIVSLLLTLTAVAPTGASGGVARG